MSTTRSFKSAENAGIVETLRRSVAASYPKEAARMERMLQDDHIQNAVLIASATQPMENVEKALYFAYRVMEAGKDRRGSLDAAAWKVVCSSGTKMDALASDRIADNIRASAPYAGSMTEERITEATKGDGLSSEERQAMVALEGNIRNKFDRGKASVVTALLSDTNVAKEILTIGETYSTGLVISFLSKVYDTLSPAERDELRAAGQSKAAAPQEVSAAVIARIRMMPLPRDKNWAHDGENTE